MLALVWFLIEVSCCDRLENELNQNVDVLRSDLVKKTGPGAETWELHEHHVSTTQGQPDAGGLLILNDFALNNVDSKEVPKK